MSSNRKRSYGAYSAKAGTASLYSGKKRYVARLPKAIRTMGPIARQAIRTGGWANPSQGPELKFVESGTTLTASGSTFTAPGATTLMNGLANGSDASTRIGRKVVLKSLYVRWSYSLAATSVGGSPARIIIFFDKQANAFAPNNTDVLAASEFNRPNNLSNRDRFITLYDHITPTVSANGEYSVAGSCYKKLNLETIFNQGTAGTIGDITSGSIYIMFAQNGKITTAEPTLTWYGRIRYSDN